MSKVVIFNHPLIDHKLAIIRSVDTSTKQFRETLNEISTLMAYEATRDLPVKEIEVQTPIAKAKAFELSVEVVIVPILRAGLGMVDGIHSLIPTAKTGHIGLYRNEETLKPERYYAKFPSTLHIRNISYENSLINGYGDNISRLVVHAYAKNSFGGYGDIYSVVIRSKTNTHYSNAFEYNGYYYTTSAFSHNPGMNGVWVNNKAAVNMWKYLYEKNFEIPYD